MNLPIGTAAAKDVDDGYYFCHKITGCTESQEHFSFVLNKKDMYQSRH
jgi:hypothetical protein